jgi:hypothetical protein
VFFKKKNFPDIDLWILRVILLCEGEASAQVDLRT